MKSKFRFEFFLVFCLCLFAASCQTDTAELDLEEALPVDAVACISIELMPARQAVIIIDLEAGQDLILSSYLNPELRDGVIDFFSNITGSREIAGIILYHSAAFNIPPALAFALAFEESRFNPRAFNRNRNETVDRGLFQLNSASFPNLSIEELYDPAISARYGLAHLRWCLNLAGTYVAALAMYNAGHNRVRTAGTPQSTLDYACRILRRKRSTEEQFMAEYLRLVEAKNAARKLAEKERLPFRLSLLAPLGRR